MEKQGQQDSVPLDKVIETILDGDRPIITLEEIRKECDKIMDEIAYNTKPSTYEDPRYDPNSGDV